MLRYLQLDVMATQSAVLQNPNASVKPEIGAGLKAIAKVYLHLTVAIPTRLTGRRGTNLYVNVHRRSTESLVVRLDIGRLMRMRMRQFIAYAGLRWRGWE